MFNSREKYLRKLIVRYLEAVEGAYLKDYPEWHFRIHVEELEVKAKIKTERDKIETIMRDLLKANVFKQVEGVDK